MATLDNNAGYTIGALVLDRLGCEDGCFGREGRRSAVALDGETVGNEEDDFVRWGINAFVEEELVFGEERIEGSISEDVESTDSWRDATDVSPGPSSLTPVSILAERPEGRRGEPGRGCRDPWAGRVYSNGGEDPIRPEIVIERPSSGRRDGGTRVAG